MRHSAVAGERSASGSARFQADMRRRGQRATARRSTRFDAAVVGHENFAALLPVRRKPHQSRLDSRSAGHILLLQRAGNLRGYRQPRSIARLEAGQVQFVPVARR